MKKFLLYLIIFLTFPLTIHSKTYEFIGILKFNMTSIMSYRLVFDENNGKITGYSITDLQGEDETKNRITGTYDAKTLAFTFSEKGIEYTKSKAIPADFCYVHFNGSIQLTNKATIKGKFEGLFKDNTKCVSGTLHLVGSVKANERMEKLNKKIQRSKRIDADTKKQLNLTRVLDSLKVNMVQAGEVTTAFVKCRNITLTVWDSGTEDNDQVAVYVNDKPLLLNYTIVKEQKTLPLALTGDGCSIKVMALNEGSIAPNTCTLSISCAGGEIKMLSHLETGTFTTLKIIYKDQD